MKRVSVIFAALLLAVVASGVAQAGQDDIDIQRLNNSLDQLANDPELGGYAQADQARARDAINQLAQASRKERAHDLYLAERRVDLAKTAAQELERQRMQYQMAQEETARLQQQGLEASQAAAQAQAEAAQAKKLAAAQSRVAIAARREAALASQAAKAMRSQLQGDSASQAPSDKPKKAAKKHPGHR